MPDLHTTLSTLLDVPASHVWTEAYTIRRQRVTVWRYRNGAGPRYVPLEVMRQAQCQAQGKRYVPRAVRPMELVGLEYPAWKGLGSE